MIRFPVLGMKTVNHGGNGPKYASLPGVTLLSNSRKADTLSAAEVPFPWVQPKFALALLAVCAALTGCTGKSAPTTAAAKKGDGAGAPVSVAKVSTRDVPVDIQVIGNVEAYSTIAVKAQVGGELTKVSFKEGDYVKSGDLLFTIDPRATRAQLQQVQANLLKNKAQLSQAQANLERDIAQQKYAEAQAARYMKL